VDHRQLRVVIVEDSAIIRARLNEALAEIGVLAIVGQAETEAEALALLRGNQWDAAILDLQLRQGTGLGVLMGLRGGGRAPHTRIIVFTTYGLAQIRERSMLLGADYFFDKSRDFHRVRDVLAALAAAPGSVQ
jgi:DNA-binding NarL/FixJ family response regulator